jgi:Cu-Zn family superoxide dismutase
VQPDLRRSRRPLQPARAQARAGESQQAHAGDLPNLVVNDAGIGHLDATTDRVTLSAGPTTLFDTTALAVGSAFIIHANPDDQLTDATNGGSGARVACAVIEGD